MAGRDEGRPGGTAEAYAAVVLAGGRAARLGGVDKGSVEHAGRPLLEHVLAAVSGAVEVVVVGDPAPTTSAVRFVREDPPFGGPVAGLVAGVAALDASAAQVAVLAVDMPLLTPGTIRRLQDAMLAGRDGAFLLDPGGHRQLAGVLRRDRLVGVLPDPEEAQGMSVRRLLARLDVVDVVAEGLEGRDVDTWADLQALGSAPDGEAGAAGVAGD